ncbi:hypothetical protein ACQR1W_26440 [Bradyrhizobium sp. HKCCYLS1011]|uniref:hypothetical protein n=1 Tax=Bradyrhizobium sp. HKCCYLS1011 TaxID=3420733 RepID=UPI003EC0D042
MLRLFSDQALDLVAVRAVPNAWGVGSIDHSRENVCRSGEVVFSFSFVGGTNPASTSYGLWRVAEAWAGLRKMTGNFLIEAVAALLNMAKSTSDPNVAAAVLDKAAEMNERRIETGPLSQVAGPRAPERTGDSSS